MSLPCENNWQQAKIGSREGSWVTNLPGPSPFAVLSRYKHSLRALVLSMIVEKLLLSLPELSGIAAVISF